MLCVRTIRFFLYQIASEKKNKTTKAQHLWQHINNFCDQRLANMYVMCTCRSAICHIYVSLEDFILPQTKTIMNSEMKFHGASAASLHRHSFDTLILICMSENVRNKMDFFAFSVQPTDPNGFDTRKSPSF